MRHPYYETPWSRARDAWRKEMEALAASETEQRAREYRSEGRRVLPRLDNREDAHAS